MRPRPALLPKFCAGPAFWREPWGCLGLDPNTGAVHVSRNDRRQGFPRWCRGSLGTGAVTRGLVEPGRICAAKFSGSPTGRLEEAGRAPAFPSEVAEAMNRAPAVYRGLPAHALLEELQLPD